MTTATDSDSIRQATLRYLWMHNRDWVEMAEKGEPVVMVGGSGVKVVDSDGETWFDVNGGYNSVNVGYGRTEIADAAYEQMTRLPYFPNGTTTVPTINLARKLAEITPGDLSRTFPVSGGSEANETALKIARAYHKRMGDPGRYKVVSRKGSYHGTTGGVLFLGGVPSDFEPAQPGMVCGPQPNPYRCPYGGRTPSECAVRCAEATEDLVKLHGPETVAALIAEPVANPMGAAVPGDEYWPMLRDICDRHGILLIADEVINGFGRTGKMFAIEHWGVVPDIMTVAKGIISSYLPLAAAIASRKVADAFAGQEHLRHVLTSSGHPVSAAAALKNIEIIESEGLVENAAQVGAYFKEQLTELMEDHAIIGDVRGLGMLMTVELVSDRESKSHFPKEDQVGDRLNEIFMRRRLIFRTRGENLTIGPPLCITREEVDEIVHLLDLSLWELEGQLGIAKLA